MGRKKAPSLPPRWIPTVAVAVILLLLLGPKDRRPGAELWAAGVVTAWVLFLAPFFCFARQKTGRPFCTRKALGVMGSCKIHRFSHWPILGGSDVDSGSKKAMPAASGTVRVEIVRDLFDLVMMALTGLGTFVGFLALIR